MRKIDFRQYARIVIIATLSISFIVIISGLLSYAVGRKKDTVKETPVMRESLDFQFMDDNKKLWDNTWKKSVLENSVWDWDRIQEFWLDTEEIGVTILEESNDALITDTFKSFR